MADIRGTSPKVWNAWKGKLLEDLYRLTLRALGGARPNLDAEIEARKLEARPAAQPARCAAGHARRRCGTRWTLSYFARHDAERASPGTRARCSRHVDTAKPVVRARLSPLGEGLQVLVYTPDQPDLFARICGYFDSAGFNILDAKVHTTQHRLRARHLPGRQPAPRAGALPRPDRAGRDAAGARARGRPGRCPTPSRGRVSRRVQVVPDHAARRRCGPTSARSAGCSASRRSDRSGLLYSIARVLARHHINLQLAKITTLGERVEDTFLIDGPALQQNKLQLQIETELLDAIAPEPCTCR